MRSDSTLAGTFRLKSLCPLKLIHLDERVIFLAYMPGGGWDLWRSDGTVDGTAVVSGFFSEARELIGEIAGDLFWRMQNHETCGLWKSHDIQVGMTLIAQLCPSEWASVNDTLFFVTQKNEFTVELWRSDGTSRGTSLIRTIP